LRLFGAVSTNVAANEAYSALREWGEHVRDVHGRQVSSPLILVDHNVDAVVATGDYLKIWATTEYYGLQYEYQDSEGDLLLKMRNDLGVPD
jgi:hypothetical protein